MNTNKRIKYLRNEILKKEKDKKYSMRDFADKMGISYGVINNIENNRVEAKDNVIKLISLTFGVNEEWLRNGIEPVLINENSDVTKDLLRALKRKHHLSDISYKLLENYLNMSESDKMAFYDFFKKITQGVNEDKPKIVTSPLDNTNELAIADDDIVEISVFEMPVSAGAGVLLTDDVPYHLETFNVKKTPQARSADFALYVKGDSMEPMYYDGDIVFVKEQPSLDNGQIGIFIYDDEAYIKKYAVDEDGAYLVSLSEKYDPIKITNSTCKICGIVL